MTRLAVLAVFAAVLCPLPAFAGEKEATAQAEKGAWAWLSLTDSGKYAESWEAVVSKAAVRDPLSEVSSRKPVAHGQLLPQVASLGA